MAQVFTPRIMTLLLSGALLVSPLWTGTALAEEADEASRQEAAPQEAAGETPGRVAADFLPEVVVYAQKIRQDILKVPSSIVKISAKEIEDANIQEMADVFARTPGLSELKGSRHSAGTVLSMRGIISGNSDYGNPSVAMFQDGTYISGGYDSDLFDVESVEVLRGPQGSLFGGNSLAGAILVRSRQPSFDWSGRANARYESYNTSILEVAGGGPISESLAFRVAGLYRTTDGYFKNRTTGNRGESGEDFNLRGQMLWQVNDDWSVNLNLNGHKYNGAYSNLATRQQASDHPYRTFADDDGYARQESFAQILTINYTGEDLAFTSITNHRLFDSSEKVSMNLNGFYDKFINFSRFRSDAWTQEFRLSSPDADRRFSWVAGVYGSYEEQSTRSSNDQGISGIDMSTGVPVPYVMERENAGKVSVKILNGAFFGQGTLGLTEKLYATLGLRYDHVTKKLNSNFNQRWDTIMMGMIYPNPSASSFSGVEKHFDTLLPKASLEYRFTPDINVYATVSRGYKPGGFQPFNPEFAGQSYDSEYSWNYEAGLKSRFFENRLELNLSGFYIDTTDLQFNTLQQGGTVGWISNAGKGLSRGGELDIKVVPLDGLEIFASAAYIDAKMRSVADNISGTFAGARVPYVPEYKTTVGAQYTFDFGLYMRAENIFTGSYYLDAANEIKQGGFAVTNLKVGYQKDGFSAMIYASNIFGRKFYSYGHVDSFADVQVVRLGSPRTLGIMVEYAF